MSRRLLRPAARLARALGAHAVGAAAYMSATPRDGTARVSYGLRVPGTHETVIGGLVKLQALSRAFPEERRRFNVLYLVSSRLPHRAVTLAAWAHRKGARVVLNQNGVAYPAWFGPGWERENESMATLLRRADYVLYQSRFCRTSADRFAAPARGPHEVLHNPVDTHRFTPAPHPNSGSVRLLLGGSQDQWYRVESAVRSLHVLVRGGLDATLLVTGRLGWTRHATAARMQLETLVASLGLTDRVRLSGPYTQADAPSIFRGADILLHTKYNDPCPTVVLEAMACGVPVVYSHSGGVPELVSDDGGVGVPVEENWEHDIPLDPGSVAEAVHQVWRDHARFASAARQRAESFDVSRWLQRHREVFARVLGHA
jgi:glycosyltransferase involved in cell wall biosynthesis